MKKIYFVLLVLLFSVTINAQIITFPDVNFKNYLLSANSSNLVAGTISGSYFAIDTNGDGEIQIAEASNVQLERLNIMNTTITDVTGLEYFTSLKEVSFNNNNQLLSVDISNLTNLVSFIFDRNEQLHTIVTTGLVNVEYASVVDNLQLVNCNLNNLVGLLELTYNQSSLVLDGLPILNYISSNIPDGGNVGALQLVSLSNLPELENVFLENNVITSITVTNLPKLNALFIYNNQITSIDLSNLNMDDVTPENGTFFLAGDNLLTEIDFTNTKFTGKDLYNNQLISINIKDLWEYDGVNGVDLYVQGNPNLQFICINDENDMEREGIQMILDANGYTNCVLNSYCSFVPGGEFYTVSGSTTFDTTNNGCDETDVMFSYLPFSITNGTTTGSVIANESGNYSIPVQSGTHTLTPILENPTYFTIAPSSITAEFPAQTSPVVQNFCITPNGIHNDVEVTLLPLQSARPGFDATYLIVYKNKGNVTLSGLVTFEFEDAKMDVVSSVPNFSSQVTGLLTYDYLNLQPFETREILLTLNINSPQETPAINNGDQLNFTAIINPLSGDEFLLDNTNSLKQIVVGSYDPNDKTCIEGDEVGPNMIGQYVHYIIRFENTGTFPAENVVVKDMINLTKFDLSTLIPTSSSHSFVTRIAANGKVEFIFENIQLPFDDANNDGYIAFKIKTLPTLVVGDTFSNNANIYFDYNFPILTNTASTTIQILGNTDFSFGDYLTLYPNPAQNSLNIKMNNEITISSISLYNPIGQLVLITTNPSENIDVSTLKTGSYFIKVISDRGISTTQFIKE